MAESGERRGLVRRVGDALARLASRPRPTAERPSAAPSTAELARFLAAELRLPLAALQRLGARCAVDGGDAAAIGRAVEREAQRLDVLVTNALELGAMASATAAPGVDFRELIERVISGQRAFIEGLAIRVHVVDCTRSARIDGDGFVWFEALAALFADLFQSVARAGRVEIRVRELLGLARLDCVLVGAASSAGPARDGVLSRRVEELVRRQGGEAWNDGAGGFGLTVPLLGAPMAGSSFVVRARDPATLAA